MFEKEFLLKNEMKHLSKAYRTNYHMMDALLHDDFFEIGVSGITYNKEAILKGMPLEVLIFEIKGFSFHVEEDYINTSYTLIKNHTEKSVCHAKWLNTLSGLKLIYFKNSSI